MLTYFDGFFVSVDGVLFRNPQPLFVFAVLTVCVYFNTRFIGLTKGNDKGFLKIGVLNVLMVNCNLCE